MRHCNVPVSTSMPAALSLTFTVVGERDEGVPAVTRNGPVADGSTIDAKPLHFREPSGQKAIGHDCKESSLPSLPVRVKFWSLRYMPRGHGTPQLVPPATAGCAPPNQLSWTPL